MLKFFFTSSPHITIKGDNVERKLGKNPTKFLSKTVLLALCTDKNVYTTCVVLEVATQATDRDV